mmetsp:Transcript_11465/g.29005  ORF Transcript_11465/g.29005 Transcript_11465/m.29005 type:complete len:97 (-) Transcript_11465:351-641(-)
MIGIWLSTLIGAGAMFNSFRLGILLLLHAVMGIVLQCTSETLTNIMLEINMGLQASKQMHLSPGDVFFALRSFPACADGAPPARAGGSRVVVFAER